MLKEALPALEKLPQYMSWTLGGGTALALHLNHRVSHDIDIFFKTVEAIDTLSPATNPETRGIAKSWREHGHFLKLIRDDGEIDFIVARSVTPSPSNPDWIAGSCISLEKPGEIIAKKLAYRGTHLKIRDVYDIAAVAALAPAELSALQMIDTDKLRVARDRTELIATEWHAQAPASIAVLPAGEAVLAKGPQLCMAAIDRELKRRGDAPAIAPLAR